MHRRAAVSFVLGFLLCGVSAARAQEVSPPLQARRVSVPAAPIMDLSPAQDLEIARWLDAVNKWRRRSEGLRNRVAHDLKGDIISRPGRPPAPEWLFTYCEPFGAHPVMLTGQFGKACRQLTLFTAAIAADALRASTQAARAKAEKPERSSFFSRVHLDGLWMSPSTRGRAYGLLGSHISLVDVGRVQVFGPPGVLLVLVPTGTGYQTRLGYTWGVSVRLTDLRLLSSTRNVTLFVSVTKCWISGSGANSALNPGFDLVGFSLAPYKRRS